MLIAEFAPCKRRWPILLLLLASLFTGSRVYAQTGDVAALPPPTSPLNDERNLDLSLPAVPQDYRIGADDLLSVSVLRMADLSREVRVADDGTIQLPLLHTPIAASGRTTTELAQAIAVALARQRLAVAPTVQVVVRQVLSRPIVVAGAVKNPMVLQAARPMRLLEVLARAGGLGTGAGTTVLLTQPTASGPVTRSINIASLTESTDAAQDPVLDGGETIRVLPARRIFVVGALTKPGAFPVQASQPITVLQALALAEGFNANGSANKKHSFIIRTTDGKREQIPVNIEAMLKHESPDPVLEAGDVLFVPENGKHAAFVQAMGIAAQIVVLGVGYNAARIF